MKSIYIMCFVIITVIMVGCQAKQVVYFQKNEAITLDQTEEFKTNWTELSKTYGLGMDEHGNWIQNRQLMSGNWEQDYKSYILIINDYNEDISSNPILKIKSKLRYRDKNKATVNEAIISWNLGNDFSSGMKHFEDLFFLCKAYSGNASP